MKTRTARTHVRSFLAVTLAAASAPTSHAGPINWLTQDITVDAGWSGGEPIGGFSSYVGHSDSTINPAVGGIGSHVIALTGRMTVGLASFLYDIPAYSSGGVDLNMTYSYNGMFSDGSADSSTRTFWIAETNSYVFQLTQVMDIYRIGPAFENVAPFSICAIESGTWSSGTFTPAGTAMDFLTTSYAQLSPGHYRFRADAANTFEANASFYDGSGVNWRAYPIPAPASLSLLGASSLLARRRRTR